MKSGAWKGLWFYLCVAKTSRESAEKPKGVNFFFSKVVELTLRNVSQECLQRQIALCFFALQADVGWISIDILLLYLHS